MIYVLIPAHNEAPTIGLLLWKVRQLFTSFNREYQLIVVNDGSTDATEEVLAPYTRALPLTLLTHRKQQGYARSMEALLREAVRRTDRPRRDMAVTLQADFSESPDDVLELIKKLEGGADVVVADRRTRADASRTEKFVRHFLPRLVNRRLGIAGADDVVGTMRGYRLGTIERLVRDAGERPFLGYSGWAADLELLARVARHARRIESVPLAGTGAKRARPSRLAPLREAWAAFRAAGALRGLPMPANGEARVEPEREVIVEKIDRRSEREQPQQERRHGSRPHEGGERRDARQRHERRQKADHRPKVERRQQEQQQRQQRKQARPAAQAPAVPVSEGEIPVPVLVSDSGTPAQAAVPAEGGQRRKRRRRGRGRGRGRGAQPGQQNGGASAEQGSTPPPAGPPPAA